MGDFLRAIDFMIVHEGIILMYPPFLPSPYLSYLMNRVEWSYQYGFPSSDKELRIYQNVRTVVVETHCMLASLLPFSSNSLSLRYVLIPCSSFYLSTEIDIDTINQMINLSSFLQITNHLLRGFCGRNSTGIH